jgi:hypothetical protein
MSIENKFPQKPMHLIKTIIKKLLTKTLVWTINFINHKVNASYRATYKYQLKSILLERAISESADFVQNHLTNAVLFLEDRDIWDCCIKMIREKTKSGICLEFGVYTGTSINYFSSKLPKHKIFGFDSFEGLAEDWAGTHHMAGSLDLGGKMPKTNSNVKLIKGWFDETLPAFVKGEQNTDTIVFIHIDSDTYEAASIILDEFKDFIRPGLLILFDEYMGYPNWSNNGEFLAWEEFSEKNKVNFCYKAFCTHQALIEIVK